MIDIVVDIDTAGTVILLYGGGEIIHTYEVLHRLQSPEEAKRVVLTWAKEHGLIVGSIKQYDLRTRSGRLKRALGV